MYFGSWDKFKADVSAPWVDIIVDWFPIFMDNILQLLVLCELLESSLLAREKEREIFDVCVPSTNTGGHLRGLAVACRTTDHYHPCSNLSPDIFAYRHNMIMS